MAERVDLYADSPESVWARKQALDHLTGEIGLPELKGTGRFHAQRDELLRAALAGRSEPEIYALVLWLGLFGSVAIRLLVEQSTIFDDPMDVIAALDGATSP